MAEEITPPMGTDGDGGDGDRDRDFRRGAAILRNIRRRRPGRGAGPWVEGYVIAPGSKIGDGRFGEVHRARDLSLTREVAIKFLKKGYLDDEVQRARLKNEAEALAMLQGSEVGRNVVEIHARSRPEDDQQYLVLEWLANGSLQERINKNGPMEAKPAAEIVRTIAGVVHGVHGLKIIHRDLKPGNVLLTHDDQPKLADFGLARFDRRSEALTYDGEPIGTPEYMSPEQACGDADEVDAASDLYSIGAILYACLTGRPPFQGPSPFQTIQIICKDETALVPPERLVPSVPRDLSTVCQKCLARKKEARYGSAAELADDLGRYLDGKPIQARPAGPVERLAKLIRRNQRVSALIGLIILSVAVGVIFTVLYAQKAKRQEARANENAQKAKRQEARANKNAELRFLALEKVLSSVGSDSLRRAGQRPLQAQLIGDLLPQFEEVIRLEGDDPATRKLQGLAWLYLSKAFRELGNGKQALEAAGNSERIFRELIAANFQADEASVGLSGSLGYRGAILGQQEYKFAEAIVALDEAARLLEPRAGDETPALLERLAHIHNNWANCLRYGFPSDPVAMGQADRHYRAAIDDFGRGARTLPTCRDWQARTLSNLALFVSDDLKRPADALPLAMQAAQLARGLVGGFPKDLDSRDCLASCLTNVGEIEMAGGNLAAARPLFVEALALYERLSLQVPDDFDFRWSVAMAYSNLGQSLTAAPGEDLHKAAEYLDRADLLYRDLVKEAPNNKDLANYVAINRGRLDALRVKSPPAP